MFRVGLGCDQHRYISGGKIILGGIGIPSEYETVAHSDGDVLLHALTDALLGAVSAGDIGELFPDSGAENKDRDSRDFVRKAVELVDEAGYCVVNVDSTVQAQKPKLAGYKRSIAENIAGMLGIESSDVSVKAKTAEEMDAIGRCEGIRADVVVMLRSVG